MCFQAYVMSGRERASCWSRKMRNKMKDDLISTLIIITTLKMLFVHIWIHFYYHFFRFFFITIQERASNKKQSGNKRLKCHKLYSFKARRRVNVNFVTEKLLLWLSRVYINIFLNEDGNEAKCDSMVCN